MFVNHELDKKSQAFDLYFYFMGHLHPLGTGGRFPGPNRGWVRRPRFPCRFQDGCFYVRVPTAELSRARKSKREESWVKGDMNKIVEC